MKKMFLILSSATLLAACNSLQWNSDILGGGSAKTEPVPQGTSDLGASDPGAPLSALNPEATAAVAADPVAAAQSAAQATDLASAAAPVFSGRASTVAGLGDPSIPGLWMETPLVSSEQRARLRSPKGTEVTVTLRPIAGSATAGSRLSISAMRALGAPLTELIEVQVLPAT
ncbi:hypothetical protein [Phaeobacter sp. CECT 5382]|uniref:lipoprotein n=1 Tax=Phaeobacter sp. CECT 5382 TaxID=1712645 RepID=UPI00071DC559|nr:hypothetical protein [Phaeobacter sp. CECT 5382]